MNKGYHPHAIVMDREAERVFHDVVLSDLAQIREFVRETAVSQPGMLTAVNELIVAVNEAAANIIRHGYRDEPGSITVQVICHSQSVKVILLDTSPGFDPTTVTSPDMTLPLEERPFGGMGVHMMREFCDEISYQRNLHGKNELTLFKRFDTLV